MKHRCSITILLSLCTMILFAQNQEVISTTGNYIEYGAGSISYTIGECLTPTLFSSNLILTQGFQQSKLRLGTDIRNNKDLGFEITAYPNPVKEFIIIKVEKNPGLSYIIYDINGVMIERKEIIGSETEINFENFSSSIYMLKVLNNNLEVKAFKIIKY
jgi:hypothetical protein